MNEPIQYREYKITQYGQSRFWLEHDEYTGDDDQRCDWASTEDEAKSIIDNKTIEEQEHQISILRKKVADAELINGAASEMLKAIGIIMNIDESQGREGCTYGDTEYDSLSGHYGSNEMLNYIKSIIEPVYRKVTVK